MTDAQTEARAIAQTSLWVPAKLEHAKLGWTYDFEQTERISRAAYDSTGYEATMEVVEFVMAEADRRLATALAAKDAELAAERAALRLAADRADRAEAPRAEARKALVPDAYEVRCTDGNYEWRRPYHGELEVIMRTGRDRSGKPFEYRALYAAVSPLSTVTPAEVGGQRCDDALASSISLLRVLGRDDEVVHVAIAELEFVRSRLTALEAQAAELAAANHAWRAMKNRAHAAEAALAEARKALEPFAREADGWDADQNDGFVFHDTERLDGEHRLNVGHLRAARRAREAQGGE